ncbi:filamentous hemagglutinin N-terminal domain-containing protein [Leptolyngbya cf. ectocarpi LEGE 11479]|uniref:Filamentous hemagglutinin N-terminal domain-containing protein n=1 Tax=Leptolyngbya cf. ectocarpi LEGE 11479 TaxID=1828722 RepID=A0A928ZXN5_LEPEC|nr:filamentous hemagglutinin N-terminal domain-containing protein [Leptolyngbya ectocarpi]MBE9069342.1 filamentous hemagglutinin N-terminal domain-containing protein [Leptolyngbya cf. ectocarpi LEGE 11479]
MASIKRSAARWLSVWGGVAIATVPSWAYAQSIIPDDSFGNRSSAVLFNGTDTYTIGNGLESGSNLFHSFERFGLLDNETAAFTSNPGILNVITRVTGGDASTISGTLQAGDVNLFVINPSGLTFTANASLDIGRSFVGSTAGSLLFEDGTRLLTGTATDFSGTGSMPSAFEILDSGSSPINVVDTGTGSGNGFGDGLEVELDQTLALIGGDITLNGGILQAPKGTLYLSALSGGESVGVSVNASTGELAFETPDSDNISASADSVISLNDSILTANLDSGETGLAGVILLRAGALISLDNKTEIQSLVRGEGEPGLISLITGDTGTVALDNDSAVFTTIERGGVFDGDVGIIFIETGFLTMDNGSQLQALVRVEKDGEPAGIGEPGNIFVLASQGIELRGKGTEGFDTGISTDLDGEGTGSTLSGDGGNLLDFLSNLSSTSGLGDLFGSVLLFTDGDVVVEDDAFIATGTSANGNAGAVLVVADNVFVESSGSISSNAVGDATGSAGVVLIAADNDIVVKGEGSNISSAVGLNASTFSVGGSGEQNGAVLLVARRVGALNGGEISVDNNSSGEAGALLIDADLVALNRDGRISAAAEGDATGGAIIVDGNSESRAFFIALANGSEISTSTNSGNGGNILLNVSPEIIAAPSQDNNILTESNDPNSNALIDVSFGSPFLRNISVTLTGDSPIRNDISAASPTNVNGTVNTTGLEDSLLQDPLLLPDDLVDPSRLIAQGCAAGDLKAAQNIGGFTRVGRAGISATPEEQISSSASAPSLVSSLDEAELAQVETWVANDDHGQESALVSNSGSNTDNTPEAQTWRYGRDGQVVLAAHTDNAPSSSVFPGFTCDVL